MTQQHINLPEPIVRSCVPTQKTQGCQRVVKMLSPEQLYGCHRILGLWEDHSVKHWSQTIDVGYINVV